MSNKKQPVLFSAGLVAQLSTAIVVAIVVPLLAGIWLSRTFNLGPAAVILAMLLGLGLGALVVYRLVKDAYDQLGGGK